MIYAASFNKMSVALFFSCNKYLLKAYHVPGTVLASWDISVNKAKIPGPHGVYILGWEGRGDRQ